jgi:DNA polymerase III psi subunit
MTRGTHRATAVPSAQAADWASLTPEALQDEIDTNARHERRVLVVAALAAALTGLALVLRTVLA